MAEKISITKGFDNDTFDTYVPQLSDNADIQNAFELFYYGDSTVGNATGDVSLHANLVDFDTRITSATSQITGHAGAVSDVHGVGAGNLIVGTGTTQTLTNKTVNLTSNTLTGTKAQFNTAMTDADFATLAGTETLTNKTLTSPVITGGTVNGGVELTVTSTELNIMDGVTASTAELNIMDGVTASTAELNYVDGVTSSIQTQINTNTPTGMISIHSASVAPTGWLLCDGTSYSTTTYANLHGVIGYTFGGSGANFNVPNLKGKVVVGIDGAQVQFDTLGETGGAMTHQHAASNSGNTSVAHNHSIDPPSTNSSNHDGHNHNVTGHTHGASHNHADTISVTIGGGSHTHGDNFGTATGSPSTTGISSGVSLTAASNNHTHTVNGSVSTDTSHAHTATMGGGVTNISLTTNGASENVTSGNTGGHAHSVDIAAFNTTGGEGGSHTHTTPASDSLSNLQPYMALNYIIKI